MADHFYDLTPVQARIFSSITKHVAENVINFGIVDGERVEITEAIGRSLLLLQRATVQFSSPKIERSPSLEHLLQHLYSPTPKISDDAEGLEIIQAPDPQRELAQVAKDIKRKIVEGQLQPHQVAVILRDTQQYGPLLAKVFNREGVPYQLQCQETLWTNPLIQAIWLFCQTVEQEQSQSTFALPSLLKCDILMPDWRLAQQIAFTWHTKGLLQGWSGWLEDLKESQRGNKMLLEEDDDGEEVDHLGGSEALDYLDELRSISQLIPSEATPSEFATGLMSALQRLKIKDNLRRSLQGLADEEGFQLLGRDYAAWQELTQIIKQLPRLLSLWSGQEPVISLASYLSHLQILLQSTGFRLPTGHPAGVIVGTPSQLRGQEFKLVFIAGLNYQIFPRAIRADWLIRDTLRAELSSGSVFLESSWELYHREKLLFYLAVNSAQEELIISYSCETLPGQGGRPSPLVSEVTRLFVPGTIPSTEVAMAELFLSEPEQATHKTELLQSLAYLMGKVRLPDHQQELLKLLAPILREGNNQWQDWRGRLKAESLRAMRQSSSHSGLVEEQDLVQELQRRLGDHKVHSITSLGDFAACPFMYLCRRLLRLEPMAQVEEELSPLTRGNVVHEVLRRFLGNYRGRSLEPSQRHQYLEEVRALIDELWSQLPILAPHPRVWMRMKKHLYEQLERLIDYELKLVATHGGKVRPWLLEWGFGLPNDGTMDPKSVPEPIEIDTPVGPIRIMGKIDRVDITSEGQTILYDYKTGKSPDMEEVKAGLNLQLPVYLWTMEQLAPEGSRPIGAAYYNVSEGKVGGGLWNQDSSPLGISVKEVIEGEDWEQMMLNIRETMAGYITAMREGRFVIQPKICSSYCHYKEICRYVPEVMGLEGREEPGDDE